MAMLQAFKDYWLVWVLFFFSNGMLPLVNTIEGSFARSLIVCDVPPGGGGESGDLLFSGSAQCGDRLRVINEGQMLSSMAASQESVAKIVMMLAAAVLTDIYGRRPVLLVGIACTALSIVLFLLACFLDDWARVLFILGQALQGAYPVELLFQQVAADLASREGADKMGIFELQGLVKFLPVVIFGFVATLIQALELRSYATLWTIVLALNSALLALTIRFYPETKVGGPSPVASKGLLAGLKHEIVEYGQLFSETRSLGSIEFVLAYLFINTIASARFSVLIMSFSMSYYAMTASQVILWALPIVLIHTVSTPLVGRVCSTMGMRRGFVTVCIYKGVASCLFLFQPFMRWAWFAQYYLSSTASGWDALTSSLNTVLFKDRIAKYMALTTLCSYGSNAVSAPMYAWLFDAKAESYEERVKPGLASFALYLLGMAIVFAPFTGVWQMYGTGLDIMQKEADTKRSGVDAKKTD
eukprot:TRINITY_DN56811_c0_g1_i2.p1 TRINITY_DN56811_c0_g1~~TRINITY_DN56811_c0_g1_i2.p1  ORF type:complete len:471 (+),score=93.56 TRINITY_DN56811_c0_g1_i2:92-1504(+)